MAHVEPGAGFGPGQPDPFAGPAPDPLGQPAPDPLGQPSPYGGEEQQPSVDDISLDPSQLG